MKILSLFDGISCARVALERAGIPIEAYYASEVDKYAIQISKKNYPDIRHIGDVKTNYGTLNGFYYPTEGGHFIETKIDLLIGGSPCQDLSIAKKNRKGLDGERSGLFWEYVRILKEVKPKYFILEDVASMPKEAKAIITEALGVEPIMINASLVSAQNRKRLFWVGKRIDIYNSDNTYSATEYQKVDVTQPEDKGILLKDILESGESDRLKSYCIDANYHKGSNWRQYKEKGRRQLVIGSQRIGDIGTNAQAHRVYSPEGKSVALSALGGGQGAKTGLYAVAQRGRNIVDGKRKDILGAKTEQRIEIGGSEKAHTITSVFKDSMVMENMQIRKLTPIECERLQGLPDNYTEGISNTQRYKCCGNAFNVDVIAHILSYIK